VAAEVGPIGYALATAARAHARELQRRLAVFGLHLGQELVIVDLFHNPSATQAELVERLGIEQPTVAKTLSRMERAGFIRRVTDERDRRAIRVSLTAAGERFVADVIAAWAAADRYAATRLTNRERALLVRLLSQVG
jgi:MarR family transcriptional regulator, organic hydroperoxide resistance regulator